MAIPAALSYFITWQNTPILKSCLSDRVTYKLDSSVMSVKLQGIIVASLEPCDWLQLAQVSLDSLIWPRFELFLLIIAKHSCLRQHIHDSVCAV